MRIVERYVLREVLLAATIALVVLTGVFAVATAFELVREGISFHQVVRVLPHTLPYTVPYTVPVAVLAGASLGIGRLGGDRELLALQGLGVRPAVVLLVPAGLGILLGAGILLLQDRIVPRAHRAKKEVVRAFVDDLTGPGRSENVQIDLPGADLFVHRVADGRLEGVVLRRNEGGRLHEFVAAQGRVHLDDETEELVIVLEDVAGISAGEVDDERGPHRATGDRVRFTFPIRRDQDRDVSFLPFAELVERRAELRERVASWRAEPPGETPAARRAQVAYGEDLLDDLRDAGTTLHGRLALSTGPLLAALVGSVIAFLLGTRPPLLSFVLALAVLGTTFFAPWVAGRKMAEDGLVAPAPAMWSGVALTLVVGLLLASRVGRA